MYGSLFVVLLAMVVLPVIYLGHLKLQCAKNSLTRVVLPFLCHVSASEQLPVYYRIQSKIATLAYKTLASCQPCYVM